MSDVGRFAQVHLEIAAATRAKRERRKEASPSPAGECALRRAPRRQPELTRADSFSFMETFLWVFGDLIAFCADDEREATELEECADDPDKVRARACDMWVRAAYRREVFEQHRSEFEYLCRRAGYPWLHEGRLPGNEETAADTAASDDTEFLEELSA